MPYRFNASNRHSHQVGTGAPLGHAKPTTLSETLLNAIPGGLAWGSLIVVLIAAIEVPLMMILTASLLSIYTSIRFLFAGFAVVKGLKQVEEWKARDWNDYYSEHTSDTSLALEDVHHLIIVPNYKEELDVMRRSLDHLVAQTANRDQVTIVLAMESGERDSRSKGEQLKSEYEDHFGNFFVEVHPRGIHLEMQCKSANEAWSARFAKRELIERGYKLENIVVTTMDADTLWHPNYLEALTVLFATNEQRYNTFWQAPIRYHSNVWEINPFMRLVHGYSTAWEIAYLAAPWWYALPMSSYSLSLKLLDSVDYWDADVIADEWHMYIKAFFYKDGNMEVEPIFLPFSGNATGGVNFLHSIKERYMQTLRHAWGAKEIGYTIAQSQNHPQISLRKRGHLLFRVAHDNLLAGAGWIILTAGLQLPAVLHPESIDEWTKTLPFILIQVSFLIVTIMSFFFWAVDVRVRPPREREMTKVERIQSFLSVPMLPTITLFCVALPVLHSQTLLMIGRPLGFRVTRKSFGPPSEQQT